MIQDLWSRFLGRRVVVARPPTRLSDDEVLAIAATVLTTRTYAVQDVSASGGGVVWTVGTRNRGVNEWVRVADATGAVIEHRRAGLR